MWMKLPLQGFILIRSKKKRGAHHGHKSQKRGQ